MNSKILNFLLIIASLLGYLEWGKNSQAFLFEVEAEILSKLFTDPIALIHPFTVLPMIGQILLMFTLFQKKPSRILTFISIGALGILLVLMFAIGIMSLNFKIIFSTIPFIVVAIIAIRHYRNYDNSKPIM